MNKELVPLGLSFQARRELAARLLPSHFSGCGRCKLPWNVVEGHSIAYSRTSGCFPICNECWDDLTPVDRVPFYLDWLRRADASMKQYPHIDCDKYDTPEIRATLEVNVLANKQDYFEEMIAAATGMQPTSGDANEKINITQ